jgi:hypothetical protein
MSTIGAITYEAAYTPTQSDTVNDPKGPFAAFICGATGDVKITTLGNQNVVVPQCQVGKIYTIAHKRVWSTGTGPTTILCLSVTPYKPSTPSST